MKVIMLFMLLLGAVLSPVFLGAQDEIVVPAAPVPEQLLTAKKVFIFNAGTDPVFASFRGPGNPYLGYNLFYANMKTWGHFELVKNPGDADLVFAIRCTAPAAQATFKPQVEVTIFDSKTHFVLWTLMGHVQDAARKKTYAKNMNSAFANLLDDLKRVISQPAAPATPN